MPAPLRVRWLTIEEDRRLEELERSRTAPVRLVERAKIVLWRHSGDTVEEIADRFAISQATVRLWINRFNRHGLAGLEDRPRSGRPVVYTAEQVSEMVALSLTDPQTLDLPFARWTLDRLAAYLAEVKGIPIKRSRISELLIKEGLRWREDEHWFGERVDPAFAEKRGRSSRAPPNHHRKASLSV